ncbi:MAG: heparan-alpha-glucosaminide N-acetyltransferase domain-containing protein, partial [Bacteroidota bacterium]
IDALLSNEFRTFDSAFYSAWFTFRGFTAPLFMFTAGTVFTYLYRKQAITVFSNPMTTRGFKRFVTLLLIGYLLHFPAGNFDFASVTEIKWGIFFSVDALHLIAFGLLFILGISFLSEIAKIDAIILFSIATIVSVVLTPIVRTIEWLDYMHLVFASYLRNYSQSYFPLFPWLGYMFAGGILGVFFSKRSDLVNKKRFSFTLTMIGISLIGLSVFIQQSAEILGLSTDFWKSPIIAFLYRLGIVFLFNSLGSFISLKIKSFPFAIRALGRHSLMIYVVHLIIVYGSAWVPGLTYLFAKSLNLLSSVSVALLLIVLMTWLAVITERNKLKWKDWFAAIKKKFSLEKVYK